jgi:hypothetical protein
MATSIFYVWVTLLSDNAANELIHGLVRKGFGVEALASDNSVTIVNDVSALCSIQLTADHTPNPLPSGQTSQGWVKTQVKEALNARKNSWYSIIVQQVGGGSTWSGSNITIPKDKPKPETPDKPTEDNSRPPTVLDRVDEALGG